MLSPEPAAPNPQVWSRREWLAMGVGAGWCIESAGGHASSQPASDLTALLRVRRSNCWTLLPPGIALPGSDTSPKAWCS
jgi:hypothetical protein